MEALRLKLQSSFFGLPFKVYDTSMKPNLLLMCKILILLLYAHGFLFYLKDPFIPFIAQFDIFNDSPQVFEYLTKSLFFIFSLLLLFNVKVRSMAILLGLTIIISLIASKPLFRNHLFIVGCMFLLSGLSDKSKVPWLIYFQLSLVYFGALTNKAFELDWWSGQFMHNWLSNALENPLYINVSKMMPDLLLAKLISYTAMLSELLIGIFLIIPKLRFSAIAIILVFHTMLFTFTGESFGFFMEDILIILIAFLNWSKEQIIFKYKLKSMEKLIAIMGFLGWDNRVWYKKDASINNNLELIKDDKSITGYSAIIQVLLNSPGFFYALLFIQLGIRALFNGIPKYLAMILFLWTFLLFLSPLFFSKFRLRKQAI